MNPEEEARLKEKHHLAQDLIVAKFDKALFDEWVSNLKTRKPISVGLLRDADDRFDPFGLLAHLNLADWTWDEDEGAWALDGSVMTVSPNQIAKWLGARKPLAVIAFRDRLLRVADGCTSLAQVGVLLEEAAAAARRVEEDYKARQHNAAERRSYAESPFEDDIAENRVLYRTEIPSRLRRGY